MAALRRTEVALLVCAVHRDAQGFLHKLHLTYKIPAVEERQLLMQMSPSTRGRVTYYDVLR